jgi:hypothetical protein
MSSNDDPRSILRALDAADDVHRALEALPFRRLAPADQRALLLRLDALEKSVAGLQRRVLAHVAGGPPPVQFAGASWAQVLARRLRIPVAEAQRRIDEACARYPRSA